MTEKQAEAYLKEAELTLNSAKAIFQSSKCGSDMWAQVVKNAYDAMEQAASGAISKKREKVPRDHPAKIKKFVDLIEPEEKLTEKLFEWLGKRSDAQYVDIKGSNVIIPHELFNRNDAQKIISDAENLIKYIKEQVFERTSASSP